MPRVLIAGCGYVGRATAELFRANGWAVEGWTSSAESAAALADEPFAVRPVDITDAVAVGRAASEFGAVIQCVSSGGGGADAYRRIYLQGARHLAAAFPTALHLFTSSTSVYAQRDGEWVNEQSAAEPQRETGKILRETEELVLAGGGIVARLAGIYGPGRSALLRKFLAGTAVISGDGTRYLNQVHRDDIAAALFLLVQRSLDARTDADASVAGIFNVSDLKPMTERACYEWLATHLGRELPPSSFAAAERKRGNTNKRVSVDKLRARGWEPQFADFPAGMLRSVLLQLALHGA